MSSSPRTRARQVLLLLRRIAVLAAMVIAFFPVFWLLSTSFKPYEEWASSPPHWLPGKPTLQNYRIVFAPEAARRFAATQQGSLDYKVSGSAWAAFGTSAFVATVATFLSVLAGTLAAYSICRFRTGGSTFAFQFLCARMFPPIAVVVPMVVLFSMLRLTDTHLGLILAYTAFTLPFSIWMIRSFIEEIPADLEGVARVHGMGQFEAFIKVTLPLIRGGLLATALFVFILNWSEFLFALTLTSGKELWIGVRAEAVRLDVQPTTKTPFEVRIRWIEDHGNRSIVHADLGGTIIKAAISPDRAISVDSLAWIGFTPRLETLFLF